LKKNVINSLQSLSIKNQSLISVKIANLKNFPKITGARKLHFRESFFRIRAGDFRIFFEILNTDKIVKITHIRRRNEKTYK
jgi:mRNA interferase RelE/StbE